MYYKWPCVCAAMSSMWAGIRPQSHYSGTRCDVTLGERESTDGLGRMLGDLSAIICLVSAYCDPGVDCGMQWSGERHGLNSQVVRLQLY